MVRVPVVLAHLDSWTPLNIQPVYRNTICSRLDKFKVGQNTNTSRTTIRRLFVKERRPCENLVLTALTGLVLFSCPNLLGSKKCNKIRHSVSLAPLNPQAFLEHVRTRSLLQGDTLAISTERQLWHTGLCTQMHLTANSYDSLCHRIQDTNKGEGTKRFGCKAHLGCQQYSEAHLLTSFSETLLSKGLLYHAIQIHALSNTQQKRRRGGVANVPNMKYTGSCTMKI